MRLSLAQETRMDDLLIAREKSIGPLRRLGGLKDPHIGIRRQAGMVVAQPVRTIGAGQLLPRGRVEIDRPDERGQRRLQPAPAIAPVLAPYALTPQTQSQKASPALPASSSSVAAARSLRPVRSTLVAPILPEPMARMSPSPAIFVITSPKGIEPSR
jgi:hypothetical protein